MSSVLSTNDNNKKRFYLLLHQGFRLEEINGMKSYFRPAAS